MLPSDRPSGNPPYWIGSVLRAVPLAFALNGLVKFAFAMRWPHVPFSLLDTFVLVGASAFFVLLMGWLD